MGLRIGEIISISLPLVSFFDGGFIYQNSSFVLVLFLLVFYFYAYPLAPLHNKYIQGLRKYSVLVVGSWLTILLIGQLQLIVVEVYKLDYGFEMMFFAKIILALVNAQIGLSSLKHPHPSILLPV